MERLNVSPKETLGRFIRGYQYMNVPPRSEGFVIPAQERGMLLLPTHTDYELQGELAERVSIHHATVLGPHRRPIVNKSQGPVRGFSVDFTPLGMALFPGIPQIELVDRGVPATDVFDGVAIRELLDRVHDCKEPRSVFPILDAFFSRVFSGLDDADSHGATLVRVALQLVDQLERIRGGPETTVREVADRLGVSTRHLNREFNRILGMGPKQHLLISRVNRAMTAMTSLPDQEVGRIGIEAGFFDHAHFCRVFKSVTLASPTEFRSAPRYGEFRVVASTPQDGGERR